MRVIIAGSRSIVDYNGLLLAITRSGFSIEIVISGAARGVDKMGEKYAEGHGLECWKYPADWLIHGKSAGYKRNQLMADKGDALIALWDTKSRGTKHMIDIMQNLGKPVYIAEIK